MKPLESLKCINKNLIKKLSNYNIKSVEDLLANANTPEKRIGLGEQTGIDPRELYFLVKVADLTQIPDITEQFASMLITVGVRDIQDFIGTQPEIILDRIAKKYPELLLMPSPEDLRAWQDKSKSIKSIVVPDVVDVYPSSGTKALAPESAKVDGGVETREEFFTGMCDLMVELGKGVASAQRELDANSMETQQLINDTPALREYGLMAQWYTMPETSFNLKMDYAVVSEKQESGQTIRKFLLSPANARYQNYFKVTQESQSQLNFRIVPIPPPSRATEVIYAPDLQAKTLSEAKAILAKAGLVLGRVEIVGPPPASDDDSIVASQVPQSGEEARFNDKVYVQVKKKAD
jgi:hypothetical protein